MCGMIRSALSLFALVGAVAAQTCVFTGPTDPTTESPNTNGTTFLNNGSDAPQAFWRQQILVRSQFFATTPMRINDFSVASKRGYQVVKFGQLTIRMGHTTVGTLSSVFADNVTTPLQDVLVANDHVLHFGVGQVWNPIGMQQSFQYSPGLGDLLIDISFHGIENLEDFIFTDFVAGFGGGTSFQASGFESSPPLIGGNSNGVLPSLRFCMDQSALQVLGESCQGATASSPFLGMTGSASLGDDATFWLSNVPPSTFAVLAFGDNSGAPYPIDLAALGAPGCRAYFAPSLIIGVGVDAMGIASHTIAIPATSGVLGQIVLGQFAALVPGANPGGILTSNYGRVMVGL
jgi:hypothetical protein